MIKVKGLVKNYGSFKVLKGIDLEVEKGKVYGFLGHNGVGKSTTMNILTGLIDYNGGEIEINGMDLRKNRDEIMKRIGYLPEDPKYYSYMSAREYLNFIGEISSIEKSKIRKRTDELLELVKLKDAAKRKIGGYSRGMRQRLGVAVATYNNPEVLFLDEPSSALDPEGRKDMIDVIGNLKKDNITVFLSTHILSDVEKVCDEIAILNEGKIVLQGDLDSLMKEYILPVYDVQFENPCSNMKKLLLSNQWIEEVKVEGNSMSIYVEDKKIAQKDLLRLISSRDNPVLYYSLRKSNLEDIFIRVVKKDEKLSSIS